MFEPPQSDDLPIEVDVHQTRKLMDDSTPLLLLDCRETFEAEICQIDGALLIPMMETPNRLAELEPYRDQLIVVYCHHGMRSLQVAQWLRDQGFGRCQSMSGGIAAWSQLIDPSVPTY